MNFEVKINLYIIYLEKRSKINLIYELCAEYLPARREVILDTQH